MVWDEAEAWIASRRCGAGRACHEDGKVSMYGGVKVEM